MRAAALISLLALPVAVWAQAPASAALRDYLEQLQSFSAGFEQRAYDEYGALLDTARGTCVVSRPDRFRWSYAAPYVQAIISDGSQLWIYDEDLQQVTVTPLGEAVSGTPAELLGKRILIEAHYDITPAAAEDDTAWFVLVPKGEVADFRRIEMAMRGGEVVGMRLHDNLGQRTDIEFSDVQRDAALDPELFEFTPPPGIEVVHGMTR